MTAAAVGSALLLGGWPRLGNAGRLAAIGAIVWAAHPLLLVVALMVTVVARRRDQTPDRPNDLLLLTDQVALGLRAGLTLEGAMDEATGDLGDPLVDEVTGVLREARRTGIEIALSRATGRAARLYRISDRAVRTGAPLGPSIEALAEELRHDDHARRTAAARRLPVRLLLPLALLILPGFVLALVGPALVTSLARLDIGW